VRIREDTYSRGDAHSFPARWYLPRVDGPVILESCALDTLKAREDDEQSVSTGGAIRNTKPQAKGH